MSPAAITQRLKEVNQLRKVCLALAGSSAGQRIQQKHKTNKTVRRTAAALGRVTID